MSDTPKNDREMLEYLMRAYDLETHYCQICGNDDDMKDCDSAIVLREYLAEHPHDELAAVTAKRDALKADAERYQFLFFCTDFCVDPLWPVVAWMRDGEDVPKEQIDSAIDAAIAQEARREG